jgi:hypothetical protein
VETPTPISPRLTAERVYETLREAYERVAQTAESPDDLPVWHLLTGAGPIRIDGIGVFGAFVRFHARDDRTMLVAPEIVAVSIARPKPNESRFPIGFGIDDSAALDTPPAPDEPPRQESQ